MRKLRNCKAEYGSGYEYLVVDEYGIPHMGAYTVLKSYSSYVVFISEPVCYGGVVYLMPRYDYSITTMEHVRKFIEDVTGEHLTITEMRKYAETGMLTPFGNRIEFARGFRHMRDPEQLHTY